LLLPLSSGFSSLSTFPAQSQLWDTPWYSGFVSPMLYDLQSML
jgi:hypothetical protein